MNSTSETQHVQQTPEQLERLLEIQLAGCRHKREKRSGNRNLSMGFGIIFIVVATAVALFALQHILGEMRSSRQAGSSPDAQESAALGQH